MTIAEAISAAREHPKGIVFRSIRDGDCSAPMKDAEALKHKDEWTPGYTAKFGYLFIDVDRI